jgi:hypothetical protein
MAIPVGSRKWSRRQSQILEVTHLDHRVNRQIFLWDFNQTELFRQILVKFPNINCHGSQHRHDETKKAF